MNPEKNKQKGEIFIQYDIEKEIIASNSASGHIFIVLLKYGYPLTYIDRVSLDIKNFKKNKVSNSDMILAFFEDLLYLQKLGVNITLS